MSRLRTIAAAWPDVAEGTSYGTPALKAAGKFVARLRDAETLVVRCPLEEKEMLMQAEPAIFFETDHYRGYPAILMRMAAADDQTIRARLDVSRQMATAPRPRRPRAK